MDRREQVQWLDELDVSRVPSERLFFGYHTVEPGWANTFPNGLREHLIYLVVSGACGGTAHGAPIRLGPGSAVWLRPGVSFALRSNQAMALYRFRLMPTSSHDAAMEPLLVLRNAWELRPTFDALVAELGSSLPFRDQRMRGLLLVLFTSIFRLAEHQAADHPLTAAQRRAVEDYVDTHIGERPRIEELASLVGLSTDYFVRRFRQTFGASPKTWLVRRRIHHAAVQLDESTQSITQVAAALGYADAALFSRQFKAVIGVSPRAYLSRRSAAE